MHARTPAPGESPKVYREPQKNEFVHTKLRNFRMIAPGVFVRVRKAK